MKPHLELSVMPNNSNALRKKASVEIMIQTDRGDDAVYNGNIEPNNKPNAELLLNK